MYAIEVRDHIMIAHSLRGAVFGPAQNLHGATFVVEVAFFRARLDADNIVVDIGRARGQLREILAPFNYANLDAMPAFAGKTTTTEFLARHIFEAMAEALRAGRLGEAARGVERLRVRLEESPEARGWYEAALDA